MAVALVAPIEGPGVAGQERPHGPREGALAGANEQVEVIGQEGPGVDRQCPRLGQGRQAVEEVSAISEDGPALDPAHHDMVQDPRRIEAWSPRHVDEGRLGTAVESS